MYRIEDKSNCFIGQKPATTFSIYEKYGSAFVHIGRGIVWKHDASDAQCIAQYQYDLDGDTDGENDQDDE